MKNRKREKFFVVEEQRGAQEKCIILFAEKATPSGSLEIGHVLLEWNREKGSVYLSRIEIDVKKNRGYGTLLLKKILRDLAQEGFKEVQAYINHTNQASKALFRKAGFSEWPSAAWDAQYGIYVRKVLRKRRE